MRLEALEHENSLMKSTDVRSDSVIDASVKSSIGNNNTYSRYDQLQHPQLFEDRDWTNPMFADDDRIYTSVTTNGEPPTLRAAVKSSWKLMKSLFMLVTILSFACTLLVVAWFQLDLKFSIQYDSHSDWPVGAQWSAAITTGLTRIPAHLIVFSIIFFIWGKRISQKIVKVNWLEAITMGCIYRIVLQAAGVFAASWANFPAILTILILVFYNGWVISNSILEQEPETEIQKSKEKKARVHLTVIKNRGFVAAAYLVPTLVGVLTIIIFVVVLFPLYTKGSDRSKFVIATFYVPISTVLLFVVSRYFAYKNTGAHPGTAWKLLVLLQLSASVCSRYVRNAHTCHTHTQTTEP